MSKWFAAPLVLFVVSVVTACGGATTPTLAVPAGPHRCGDATLPPLVSTGCATLPATSLGLSASAAVTPTPSFAETAATQLPRPPTALDAGRYANSRFEAAIAFTVPDGWTAAQAVNGFFDVESNPGSPEVVAVQFANVDAQSLGQAIEE